VRLVTIFFVGLLVAALPIDALSVYLLHDVDAGKVGQWSAAFRDLNVEMFVFSVITSVLLFVFLWLGRKLFRTQLARPHLGLVFLLGAGVVVVQYLSDIAARALAPATSQLMLSVYILLSPAVCDFILLRNSKHQSAV
jgi:hypothetical protein